MRLLLALLLFTSQAWAQPQEKSIDVAVNGPTLLINGSLNRTIKITGVFLTANVDTFFYFSSNSTALSGPLPLQAFGCFFTPRDGGSWFTLNKGESLYLTQNNSAQLSGRIYYTQE
jgi:hypothetical protein